MNPFKPKDTKGEDIKDEMALRDDCEELLLQILPLKRVEPADLPRVIAVSTPSSRDSWVDFYLNRFNRQL